ncbi:MAG: diguanylate cyclase [Oscillospiraceae bacterium]|nr:diguanylate cyclase [Oscillospiraceae bacterium]
MKTVFADNLKALRQLNLVVAILAAGFSIFPIFIERNFSKAFIYVIVAAISLLLGLISRFKLKAAKRTDNLNSRFIYAMTILYYANVMLFGIYLGAWAITDTLAVTFMGFLIVALLLLVNPPVFNLCLTTCALVAFSASSVLLKESDIWVFDIANALIAYCMSLVFGWVMNMYRLSAVLNASRLEEERSKYYSQSTIDELTQLKNRRYFMNRIERYVTNYRDDDKWICLAIIDIDYFKRYNDYYGHPKGDEVLRAFGEALGSMQLHDGGAGGITAARIGGEEFTLLWFEQDAERINSIISSLQEKVRQLNLIHEKSDISDRVTVSIGVYVADCCDSNTVQVVYDNADKALYEAKNNGRNCAVINGDSLKQYSI